MQSLAIFFCVLIAFVVWDHIMDFLISKGWIR